jgi:hypothetical protein
VFAFVFVSADIKLHAGQEREVSARQIAGNLRSIWGGQTNTSNLEGTRAWRLQWWQDIIDYTVHGAISGWARDSASTWPMTTTIRER